MYLLVIYLARPRRAAPQKVARLDDEGAEDAEERGRQVGDGQAEDQAGEQTVPELCPPAENSVLRSDSSAIFDAVKG